MTLEQRVRKLEQEVDKLDEDITINYEDIKAILKYLKKKYPQDFLPGGQFKPGVI